MIVRMYGFEQSSGGRDCHNSYLADEGDSYCWMYADWLVNENRK
jgi:hypothetical protein